MKFDFGASPARAAPPRPAAAALRPCAWPGPRRRLAAGPRCRRGLLGRRGRRRVPPPPPRLLQRLRGHGLGRRRRAAEREAASRFDEQTSNQVVVAVFPALPWPLDRGLHDPHRAGLAGRARKKLDNGVVLFVFVQGPEDAHRGRLRPGGRAARHHGQAHHRRVHHPAFRAGRLRRRPGGGDRRDHRGHPRRIQGRRCSGRRRAGAASRRGCGSLVLLVLVVLASSSLSARAGRAPTAAGAGTGGGPWWRRRIGGRRRRRLERRRRWGGGGGGGGGFSGGGGSFGGGGASGDW